MTSMNGEELREDFLNWSGGFPPDSPEQVTVYIDYTLSRDFPEAEARAFLLEWLALGDGDEERR